MITGCQDSTEQPGAARLWDAETGKPLGPPMSHGQIMAVAFSPDGKLAVTGGVDRTARLWNTSDSTPAQPPWPYGKNVATAALLVVSAGVGSAVTVEVTVAVLVIVAPAWSRPTCTTIVDPATYKYPSALIMPGSAGTNWWKAVFGSGQYRDANLAVSGGGDVS